MIAVINSLLSSSRNNQRTATFIFISRILAPTPLLESLSNVSLFNTFVLDARFLYILKTSENPRTSEKVF